MRLPSGSRPVCGGDQQKALATTRGSAALSAKGHGCYDAGAITRTAEDMAAYLEASIEEADGDAAFVAKALGDIARARGMAQRPVPREPLQGALGRARSNA